MANVRVTVNIAAFNELRNSAPIVGLLEQEATRIRDAATAKVTTHEDDGEPFTMDTVHNRSRAVTFVSTHNFDGMHAEAAHRALTYAVGGA